MDPSIYILFFVLFIGLRQGCQEWRNEMNTLAEQYVTHILKVHGIKINKKKELSRLGFRAIKIEEMASIKDLQYLLKKEEMMPLFNSKEFKTLANCFVATLKSLEQKQNAKVSTEESILDSVDIHVNLDPVGRSDEYIYLDSKTNRLIIGHAHQRLRVESLKNKEKVLSKLVKSKMIKLIFNVNKPSGLQPMGDSNYFQDDYAYNLYRQQEWEFLGPSEKDPECFIKLVNHVFPDETQRADVFSWVIHMLEKRNDIALVLLGIQGVGKSTFVDLLFNIVGLEVSSEISDRFFDSNFNEEIRNKKLICFEEVVCRGDNHKSKLKRNMNEHIMIEGKNKKVEWEENHASFIFTCNHPRLLEVEPRDRRFFIPDLGKGKAPENVIAEVKRARKNPQFLCDVVHYIRKNLNPKFDRFLPNKNTKSFWEMVRHGSSAPIRHAFRLLEEHENEWVTYRQMLDTWETKRAANVLFPDFDELCNFFSDYKPMGVSVIEIDHELSSIKYNSFGQSESVEKKDEEWTQL